jgi:hypothetical protein
LAGIAVTDHESLAGSLAARDAAPSTLLVIAGMEIYTEVGDIVCLFLREEIASRDALTVIAEVHRQGGVAFLPHPLRSHPEPLPDAVLDAVDAYEALNSRAGFFDVARAPNSATNWSRLAGKAVLGNSDAHFASEIGRAHTLIEGPATAENIRQQILTRKTASGGMQGPALNFYGSQIVKMFKTRDAMMLLRLGQKVGRKLF